MRITNSTLLRNYDRNLKRISTAKYSSENKIYSGRQYTRAEGGEGAHRKEAALAHRAVQGKPQCR